MTVKEALFVAVMLTDPIMSNMSERFCNKPLMALVFLQDLLKYGKKKNIITPTFSFKNHNEDQIFIYPLSVLHSGYVHRKTYIQPTAHTNKKIQVWNPIRFNVYFWKSHLKPGKPGKSHFLCCLTHQIQQFIQLSLHLVFPSRSCEVQTST